MRGDQDHPFSHGYTCAKGRALPRMHHHPDRLERPLMRVGDELQPTTWDACLDDLGTRLRAIIDADGPEAIGVFFGSGVGMDAAGYRMAEALHAAIGTPARFSPLTIDGTAKVLVSRSGRRLPAASTPTSTPSARRSSSTSACNPVVSHGHTSAMPDPVTAIRALRDARRRVGRRSRAARRPRGSRPDHLAPRPGTDYAVLAFLVRELLRDGADRDVLEHRHGRRRRARGRGRAVHRSSTRRAVADVAEADLTELLDAVRRAGRVAVVTGTGVTMSASANVTQWLAWALMIVTGSMNRPGGVLVPPGVRPPARGLRAPDLTARRPVRARPDEPSGVARRSSASGRAPCSPTRSAPATSARC